MKSLLKINSLIFILFAALVSSLSAQTDSNELYRIRIQNCTDGFIQASSDGGKTYTKIGIVTNPAEKTAEGFLASKYVEPGKIAATAVHGLRIKTEGNFTDVRQKHKIFSIVPKEFSVTPKGFGGHIAGTSGIYTDIPAGYAIFRNLAPFAGDSIYLEQNGQMHHMPIGYTPNQGDILVIVVNHRLLPKEVIFQNEKNGSVKAIYDDREEIIGKVSSPVKGIGRFDATGYTGLGAVNTNHPGVITISTTPLNGGEMGQQKKETRGGFQIIPDSNAKTLDITKQLLVVESADKTSPIIEGKPPLFMGCIGLTFDEDDPTMRYYMDIRSESSDWVSLPSAAGKNDNLISNITINDQPVKYMRLRFPSYTKSWIEKQIKISAEEYSIRAKNRAIENNSIIVSGNSFVVGMDSRSSSLNDYVKLYIDGEFRGISNSPPYEFTVNLSKYEKGEHKAELVLVDKSGITLKKNHVYFYIQ